MSWGSRLEKKILRKKRRFYSLSSWSAYNICIYIIDIDTMSMFLHNWKKKEKNITPKTGTKKGPYLKG